MTLFTSSDIEVVEESSSPASILSDTRRVFFLLVEAEGRMGSGAGSSTTAGSSDCTEGASVL
ncbi:MAG: hypothetical protein GWP27_03730 [Bacteroidetes bacterium]|nr:hypothetical protein [Bacteroidota bacterium]